MARLFIPFIFWSAICFSIGLSVDGNDIEYREKVVEKPVVERVEVPVEVRVMPAACKTALELAVKRSAAAKSIDKASSTQLDILSKVRQVLASSKSPSELNKLETQQRLLQGQVVAWSQELASTEKQYAEAYATCKKESP